MRVSRQDLRLAVRSFARHPGFTATAILSLALAIALNTTMYSVIDAMVKPNVDIQHSERFYRIILWHDRRRPIEDARLTDERFDEKCQTPAGTPITIWKWLRAMIEHEAHHRGQLYFILGMRGVATPPIYGLTAEQVREHSIPFG